MNVIEKPSGMATVAESCDLAINTGKIIQNGGTEDAYLKQQSEILSAKGEQMKISIAADRRKEKTEELATLDSTRDSCIVALKLLTQGYMKWEHNNQQELASRIYNLIKKHGLRMTYENYEEESALTESLLKDLEQPALQEAVIGLNLAKLVDKIRQTQTSFSESYRESAAIEAGKDQLIAATQIKNEVRAILTDAVKYLNAMTLANPESYSTLASEVAEVVNSLNQKIRTRKNNN